MKKILASFFGIWFLILTSTAAVSAPTKSKGTNNPFVELNGELVSVQGAVTSLQDQIDLLVARVDTLEDRVGANEDAIATLNIKNADLQVLIDTYGSDLATLQGEVDAIEAANLQLQSLIDAGDTTLQDQVDANNEIITSLNLAINDLSGLQDQIDNNNLLIATLQASIAEISAILEMKQNLVTGNCINGEAIQQILSDGSVVCAGSSGGGSGGVLRTIYADKGFPIAGNTYAYERSYCPSGWTATGSGFITNQGVMVLSSYNFNGVATQVSAYNTNSSAGYVIVRTTCSQI